LVYKKGDVVVARFPYVEGTGAKPRPCLIVSSKKYFEENNQVIALQITSRKRSKNLDAAKIEKWKEAGLDAPSVVRPKPVTLPADEISGKIGRIDPADLQRVMGKFIEVLNIY
jgi:mRNA-degrading endonuclease toxin of MazEF toxin-antitoxin module